MTEMNRDITFLVSRHSLMKEGNMDHNEAVRKFEHLMLKEADHARRRQPNLKPWFRSSPMRNLGSSRSSRQRPVTNKPRSFAS
jgi:hypothetical protein